MKAKRKPKPITKPQPIRFMLKASIIIILIRNTISTMLNRLFIEESFFELFFSLRVLLELVIPTILFSLFAGYFLKRLIPPDTDLSGSKPYTYIFGIILALIALSPLIWIIPNLEDIERLSDIGFLIIPMLMIGSMHCIPQGIAMVLYVRAVKRWQKSEEI